MASKNRMHPGSSHDIPLRDVARVTFSEQSVGKFRFLIQCIIVSNLFY